MEIIEYKSIYREAFKKLNIEWLEKYFVVEPIDHTLLSDPENEIISKGGLIYLVRLDNKIVGTVALLKVNNKIYELSKMAITDKYQGKGIGKKLLYYCIDKVKNLKASKIILYSNTKLIPAIELYKKCGFIEVYLDSSEYERANIKMELSLNHE